jgi:hypothetical protein
VGGLVQRVIEHRALQHVDRRGVVARLRVQVGELDEQRQVALAQRGAARTGPLLVAVLGQQIARVEVEGGAACLDRALLAGGVGGGLELVDVDLHRVLVTQGEHVVAQRQVAGAAVVGGIERAPGDEDHLPQVVGSRARVAVGPERLGDLLAVQVPLRGERQQLDQALAATQAPGALGYHSVARSDGEAAQQTYS